MSTEINLPCCSRFLSQSGLRRPLLLARAVVETFAKPADIGAPHKRNHVSLSWERQHLASPEGKKEANRSFPASRSEEHTSELQSLMSISYAVFCLKKKKKLTNYTE